MVQGSMELQLSLTLSSSVMEDSVVAVHSVGTRADVINAGSSLTAQEATGQLLLLGALILVLLVSVVVVFEGG